MPAVIAAGTIKLLLLFDKPFRYTSQSWASQGENPELHTLERYIWALGITRINPDLHTLQRYIWELDITGKNPEFHLFRDTFESWALQREPRSPHPSEIHLRPGHHRESPELHGLHSLVQGGTLSKPFNQFSPPTHFLFGRRKHSLLK